MDSPQRVVLDMDSTETPEIPVYGDLERNAYNGHFESTCYHPLLLFNEEGDCLGAKLRPGNVHSAEDWEEVLLPEIERQQELGKEWLGQTSVLDVTPNGYAGSVWMAGEGLAADSSGNIYFLDANGLFDTTLNSGGFPINGDYGNAFMKISTSGGTLAVADYFNMDDTVEESANEEDLGSGGVIVLPDLTDNNGQVHHLAVGAGKDTNIYVVNRDNMGKWNPNNDNQIYQEIDGALPGGVWSSPAYWNNTVYYGDVGDNLKAFSISNAMLSITPTSQTGANFPYPVTTPTVSANQTSNAIVWVVSNSNPAVLYAFRATNLANQLYNSNQAGSRDQFGPGNKFITPMVANGKVFVGTQNGVAVFGLLQ
jgi:hypothetical protein